MSSRANSLHDVICWHVSSCNVWVHKRLCDVLLTVAWNVCYCHYNHKQSLNTHLTNNASGVQLGRTESIRTITNATSAAAIHLPSSVAWEVLCHETEMFCSMYRHLQPHDTSVLETNTSTEWTELTKYSILKLFKNESFFSHDPDLELVTSKQL